MSKHVRVFDTTLRDGDQTPGVCISSDHKLDIAKRLEAFGVATIEAGFPISSPGEREAVARIARHVAACEVAALARCKTGDVDAAAQAVASAAHPVIHVFLGVSDVHLAKKLRMSRAQAVRAIEQSVRRARDAVAAVEFSPEDATRAERPFLRQCIETAVRAGATRINIPDTVGCALPTEFAALIRDVVRFVGPGVIVSAHCHNDMGMATANTIAAVQAGARQVEVTVNGIGERAGNTAVEEVAVALALKDIADTGLDLAQITAISRYVSGITGIGVQAHHPVIGANAFAHSSGIHQDGILKDPEIYQFVPPELVGAEGHRMILTGRSGRHAVAHRAAAMGVPIAGTDLDAVYDAVIRAAESAEGAVSDQRFEAILRDVCTDHGHAPRPPRAATVPKPAVDLCSL